MFGFLKKKKRSAENPLDEMEYYLRLMGYDFTPRGGALALAVNMSGYTTAESASYIALHTMARDIKEIGTDALKMLHVNAHAMALLDLLKELKNQRAIHPNQWANDAAAFRGIAVPESGQEEWLQQIISSDPVASAERLATSRISYVPPDFDHNS